MSVTEEITATGVLPRRLLLGPGPSELDPEVLRAMTRPPLGHLDPALLEILADVQDGLREAFRTGYEVTLALSGTGTSGMQASLANTIEPGDSVVVGTIGYFGERLVEMAERLGARVTRVSAGWGESLDPDLLREAVRRERPRVVAVVHGETATGVAQGSMPEIATIAHEADALLVVDSVASLGGHPVNVDEWGVDVCYSGSQKALGAPSGMAPITASERAMERLRGRRSPVSSFYLDLGLLADYWIGHKYHHTISAPLIYALQAALGILRSEGLEARWRRHERNYLALRAGLEAMGLSVVAPADRVLWTVAAVRLPEKVDAARVQRGLLEGHDIDVAGGLGPLRGKVIRIGLMGYGSQQRFVLLILGALEQVLRAEGYAVTPGAGLSKAMAVYEG